MKRREFFRVPTALVGSLALPSAIASAWAGMSEAPTPPPDTILPDFEIRHLRVGNWHTEDLRLANRKAQAAGLPLPQPDPPDDESNYWAQMIRHGDRYFYRARGATIGCTQQDFRMVCKNPNLYYFSTALRLHCAIGRQLAGV